MMGALLLLFILLPPVEVPPDEVYLPIRVTNRHSAQELALTAIGRYGVMRKARPAIPSHYHTGIDIRRPHGNYANEPIYPIAKGIVISIRTDGPYAQLIIEHEVQGMTVWTVYEHVAGITVKLHSMVEPLSPIARFLNREELQRYGWQFDHFHLEVLKVRPIALKPGATKPDRNYASYSLLCYSSSLLQRYFYNPVEFFARSWSTTLDPSPLEADSSRGK